eukprot:UN09290
MFFNSNSKELGVMYMNKRFLKSFLFYLFMPRFCCCCHFGSFPISIFFLVGRSISRGRNSEFNLGRIGLAGRALGCVSTCYLVSRTTFSFLIVQLVFMFFTSFKIQLCQPSIQMRNRQLQYQ